MNDIIFYKANNTRKPIFRTQLHIINKGNTNEVWKSALEISATNHIHNCYKNALRLSELSEHFNLNYKWIDNSLVCDYVKGKALSQELVEIVKSFNTKTFFALIDWFVSEVNGLLPTAKFQPSSLLEEMFGLTEEIDGIMYTDLANIDFNFDNIILVDKTYKVIDTEWIFNVTLPKNYIIFRSLLYLFVKYGNDLQEHIILDDVLKYLDFSSEECLVYEDMENMFQNYVYGKERFYSHFSYWCNNNVNSENTSSYCQIYYSDDEKLYEDRSIKVNYSFKVGEQITISLSKRLESIHTLRIDPINIPCLICNPKLVLIGESESKEIDLTLHYHNASILQDNCYFFLDNDSQYIIDLKNFTVLNIEFNFTILSHFNFQGNNETLITQLKNELALYNDKVNIQQTNYEKRIGELQNENACLENQLFLANGTIYNYHHPIKTVFNKIKKRGKI